MSFARFIRETGRVIQLLSRHTRVVVRSPPFPFSLPIPPFSLSLSVSLSHLFPLPLSLPAALCSPTSPHARAVSTRRLFCSSSVPACPCVPSYIPLAFISANPPREYRGVSRAPTRRGKSSTGNQAPFVLSGGRLRIPRSISLSA